MEDFKKYPQPLTGLFHILKEDGEYSAAGWVQVETKAKIIGETHLNFVTGWQNLEYGEWIGDQVTTIKKVIPLGIHKSRFIKWLPAQLSLFD